MTPTTGARCHPGIDCTCANGEPGSMMCATQTSGTCECGSSGAAGSAGKAPTSMGGGGSGAKSGTAAIGGGTPAPAGMAGMSGTAGTTATAGASGDSAGATAAAGSGGAVAGASGSGGSTSSGSGGDCGPNAFACRGPAPTMESAKGTAKGPYPVGMMTSGYRNGPEFADATIFYPMGDAAPPFGCVSVCPGFASPQSTIRTWGPFLASHGIVTITIGTNSTSDPPQTRAKALMDALETCTAENTREDSPIKGKIATDHLGVSGWSMGGGGTLIAAAANPMLKAAVSFAAWQPSGGAMNKVPVLMFEGTNDVLAAGMSEGYYSQTPDSVPKMLFEVSGAPHEVANNPANSNGTIGLYGLSWWKVYLEGDERYKQFLLLPKPSITAKFMTNVK
jgi:dienelactone hydrolase